MADKKADADKKPASADDIMSPADMKPILAKARRGNPISCVIGMTKDKAGLILLDRKRRPKKLMAELKKQAADLGLEIEATSLRFGTASVDAEDDPKLIMFAVNKEPPGALRLKLIDQVKRAGFADLDITIGGGE
jgi:hypothetical protein